MRALAVAGGDRDGATAFAESQLWLEKTAIVTALKSAVGDLNTGALATNDVVVDFLAAVRPHSILARLDRVRKVPSRTRLIAFGTGATAYVVGERQAIPMSKTALLGIVVEPRKVAALTVTTKELVQSQAQGVDQAIATDLATAVGEAEDGAFFVPTSTGSILNGAPTAVSAGTTLANIDTDLQKAIELLLAAGGQLQDALWVLSPEAAAKLAGLRGTGGALAFPGMGPNGGTLLGLPAITSASADGYIGLLDQSGIMVGSDASAEITWSPNALLQMSDTPTSPPTAPVSMVSIFQTEAIAFKAVLHRGWKTRAGAGAYISGGAW